MKGPRAHAWKGTGKFLLAPQRRPGCDAGAGTTVERRVKKTPAPWVLPGPQQRASSPCLKSHSVNQLTDFTSHLLAQEF